VATGSGPAGCSSSNPARLCSIFVPNQVR
jgi:hypothetical protein